MVAVYFRHVFQQPYSYNMLYIIYRNIIIIFILIIFICYLGLGWVTITGSGTCQIKVTTPQDVEVGTRAALLPYESSTSTAKFTGSRLNKTSKKKGTGKSYGWRA